MDRFTHIIRSGELQIKAPCSADDIMEEASGIMDAACTWDVLGSPILIGQDGKVYCVSLEATIGELNLEFAIQALEDAISDLAEKDDDFDKLTNLQKTENSEKKMLALVELYVELAK